MPVRVLIIDDEPLLVRSLVSVLQSAQYSVASATNTRDGLTLLQSENFDDVLLDLTMPDRYGLDLVPEIVSTSPNTTIIIFAADAREETRAHAFQLGVSVFLLKPSDPGEVLKLLFDLSHGLPVSASPNIYPNPNK